MTKKTNIQIYKNFKGAITKFSDRSLAILKVVVENEEKYRLIKPKKNKKDNPLVFVWINLGLSFFILILLLLRQYHYSIAVLVILIFIMMSKTIQIQMG